MAKRSQDDFNLDDIGSEEGSAPPKKTGAGGLPAPIAKAWESVRDFFSNIALSMQGAMGDKDRPLLPIALLGGAAVIALLLIIVLLASLGGGGNANPNQAQSHGQAGAAAAAADEKSGKADQTAAGESGSRPLVNQDFGLRDSFISQPILPDEPNFMLQGEIQYQRPQKDYWDMGDIKPGWQNLDKLNRAMLREKNSEDFHRLIGETPPPKDRY